MSAKARLRARILAVVIGLAGATAPAATAWQPEPASYGVGSQLNLPVKMSDGTVLRANVYFPTDLNSKAAASGPFPVILTQTPYGKDNSASGGSLTAGQNNYLVQRGYINVVADVRGTGGSQGEWGLFDPIQGQDGATLVNWAAGLPHSTGSVGLFGPSYLGINQFETAADAGPTHVKAMFPIIAGNDLYRDTAFAGGFPDLEFSSFYLALTAGLNLLLPAEEHNNDLFTALTQHVHDLATFDATLLTSAETGGDTAYDQNYWGARNPVQYIPKIVQDGIPAFLIGGWYDLFQRGELLNYSSFQNAYNRRPTLAPMSPSEPVTPRYQLIQGPWYHITAGTGLNYHGLDMNGVALAWFDHWLKGIDTGITDTKTPLHLEDLATGSYSDVSRYPLDQAAPTSYYLQPGGGLSTSKPVAANPPDGLLFTGTEIPCTTSTEQWAAGLGVFALSFFGIKDPCTQNSAPSQLGPGTRSYTTAPFAKPTVLAGPIGATLYASATTKDTEWVVQVSDVAPNGTSAPLTSGLLEGNQRAVDSSMTWYAPDGNPLLPYHPYTKVAQSDVVPGKVTRYDVEVFPTFNTLQAGHRLRVTIATSDFPHALPSVTQGLGLLGGLYQLQHSPDYPSSVELPLVADPASLSEAPHTPLGCPAAAGRLSATALGPVRMGMGRRAARAALVASSTRGRRYMDFFCLAGGGIRAGYATPKLLHTLGRAQRGRFAGRVILALTANRRYSAGGVRARSNLKAARRHLRLTKGFIVGKNTWYLAPLGSGRVILKVRHGQVQEIGIASAALTRNLRADRRFLTSFY